MLVGCFIVFKLTMTKNSVNVIIVRDEKVVLLEESSKSFAYGGAYHQPQPRHEKHFEDLSPSHRHRTWLDLTLLITDGIGVCSAETDMMEGSFVWAEKAETRDAGQV